MNKYYVADSSIHGKGVFITSAARKGDDLGTAVEYGKLIIQPYVTDYFGKWVNHSYTPTCVLRFTNRKNANSAGEYHVYASRRLPAHTEITCDYNDTPSFIERPKDWYR